MTQVFSGTDGALAVGAGTVGATQVVDGSLPQTKLTTPLLIDASVRPMFSAIATASYIPANSEVVFLGAVEEIDTTGAYSTSTYRFTPQVQGYYSVTFMLKFAPASTTDTVSARIRKNGTSIRESYQYQINGSYATATITALVSMNGTTDYLDATHTTSTAGTVIYGAATGSCFQAFLISRSA